jgi:hypothetical protein
MLAGLKMQSAGGSQTGLFDEAQSDATRQIPGFHLNDRNRQETH